MYTSRQCTYTQHTLIRFEATDSGSNERMTIPWVPIFPSANRNDEGHLSLYWWGWHGHRLFQEQTTMKRPTCRSIDGNKDADNFNSEYKNNIPMKTSRQCVYAHAKQVWGNGQFQQANEDKDIKYFLQANNNEPLAFALLMVSKMRTSSIVNTSTGCQMQKRAKF